MNILKIKSLKGLQNQDVALSNYKLSFDKKGIAVVNLDDQDLSDFKSWLNLFPTVYSIVGEEESKLVEESVIADLEYYKNKSNNQLDTIKKLEEENIKLKNHNETLISDGERYLSKINELEGVILKFEELNDPLNRTKDTITSKDKEEENDNKDNEIKDEEDIIENKTENKTESKTIDLASETIEMPKPDENGKNDEIGKLKVELEKQTVQQLKDSIIEVAKDNPDVFKEEEYKKLTRKDDIINYIIEKSI